MDDFWRAEKVTCSRELRADSLSRVRAVSLALEPGTITMLGGPAGSGKNLLLRLCGLLETPDAGEVFLHGQPTRALPDEARLALRNRHCGFVFAEPFLLNTLSVLENVAMPLFKISGLSFEAARAPITEMLTFVGLTHSADLPAEQLPHAGQQKISLARALINRPDILLVENLGERLPQRDLAEFAALLMQAQQTFGTTILATAEHRAVWPEAPRYLEMAGGEIAAESRASAKLT